MIGRIIKHRKESVTLIPLARFKKMVKDHYNADKVEFTEHNDGMCISDTLLPWASIAADMEWFDDAEVVTDKNENERVMVWLNID